MNAARILQRLPRAAAATQAARLAAARLRAWLREDDGSWQRGAPRPFLLFLLLFGVGMLLVTLFGDQGLLAYRSLRREEIGLVTEIQRLALREGELREQIRALHNDPGYVELLARRKLGLVKPGETVILLPREDP
jgi:cell division protein FtsB